VALACAAVVCGGSCSSLNPEGERLAASVNGERVTFADLERYEAIQLLSGRGAERHPSPEQEQLQRLTMLRELVDQRLLLQKADAQGLMAADAEVEAVIDRYRVPYRTPDEFDEHLTAEGIDPADLRVEIRRQLTVEKLLVREVSSRVKIDESAMREYYDSNLAAFTVPEDNLHLAQILVGESQVSPIPNLRNDDATGLDAARRKIRRIQDELESGEDFEELAALYSEDPASATNGGDMGFIPLSSLGEADIRLRRALIGLQPGATSGIVETDGEFRILRLLSIEPAGRQEFEDPEVQASIRELLANRLEQLLRTAFYEMERSGAEIHNHLAERIAAEYGLAN